MLGGYWTEMLKTRVELPETGVAVVVTVTGALYVLMSDVSAEIRGAESAEAGLVVVAKNVTVDCTVFSAC